MDGRFEKPISPSFAEGVLRRAAEAAALVKRPGPVERLLASHMPIDLSKDRVLPGGELEEKRR